MTTKSFSHPQLFFVFVKFFSQAAKTAFLSSSDQFIAKLQKVWRECFHVHDAGVVVVVVAVAAVVVVVVVAVVVAAASAAALGQTPNILGYYRVVELNWEKVSSGCDQSCKTETMIINDA